MARQYLPTRAGSTWTSGSSMTSTSALAATASNRAGPRETAWSCQRGSAAMPACIEAQRGSGQQQNQNGRRKGGEHHRGKHRRLAVVGEIVQADEDRGEACGSQDRGRGD